MGTDHGISRYLATDSDIRLASHSRADDSDKYGHGTVVIVGGSSQYYGAPVLATNAAMQSIAALRVGVGYVRSYVPGAILAQARSFSPNTIVEPLGRDCIAFSGEIRKQIGMSDALLIGMGVGRSPQERRAGTAMIRHALKHGTRVVADAAAIEALGAADRNAGFNVIITPHRGELSRLIGREIPQADLRAHIRIAKAVAMQYGVVVVLKGHNTIITDGSRLKINSAKTAALSTMGTGDVLSGIAVAYAASCGDMFTAATAAVRLHSKIGDYLHEIKGDHAIATDVIDAIPAVAKRFDS